MAIDAADTIEQCRLARPVGADQTADLATLDIERHTGKRDHAAEAHDHVAHAKQGGIGPSWRRHAVSRSAGDAPRLLPIRRPRPARRDGLPRRLFGCRGAGALFLLATSVAKRPGQVNRKLWEAAANALCCGL